MRFVDFAENHVVAEEAALVAKLHVALHVVGCFGSRGMSLTGIDMYDLYSRISGPERLRGPANGPRHVDNHRHKGLRAAAVGIPDTSIPRQERGDEGFVKGRVFGDPRIARGELLRKGRLEARVIRVGKAALNPGGNGYMMNQIGNRLDLALAQRFQRLVHPGPVILTALFFDAVPGHWIAYGINARC